jgi:hypothetical protein
MKKSFLSSETVCKSNGVQRNNFIKETPINSYTSAVLKLISSMLLFIIIVYRSSKTILGNDQLDALFLNVFILRLYMFRAASAHHQEGQIVLIHHLV